MTKTFSTITVTSLVLTFLSLLPLATEAFTAERLAIQIDDRHTLFVLPFSFSQSKYPVIGPTTALRDVTSTTSLTYTLKTPEGLRRGDGRAASTIVKDKNSNKHVLYVLYQGQASSTRVNTLQLTGLPYWIVTPTGTSSNKFEARELRNFNAANSRIKRLQDLE